MSDTGEYLAGKRYVMLRSEFQKKVVEMGLARQ